MPTGTQGAAKIIINADDLGISQAVNDAVFDLMSRGRISSATALVGGPAFADACRRSQSLVQCSFGVHLYVTELTPQTDPKVFEEHGLISPEGNFNSAIRTIRPTTLLKAAILEEWGAQLGRAREGGLKVSHVDSHHHVHTIPWLLGVLSKLVRRDRVAAVRRSMDLYDRSEVTTPSLRLKKMLWNHALTVLTGAKSTRHSTNFRWFVQMASSGALNDGAALRGPIELMCHPGNPGFASETALLDTDWSSQIGFPVDLISFNDL